MTYGMTVWVQNGWRRRLIPPVDAINDRKLSELLWQEWEPEHGEHIIFHKLLPQVIDVDLLDTHCLCFGPDWGNLLTLQVH